MARAGRLITSTRRSKKNSLIRTFEAHEEAVAAVVVFPDGRRMVTSSWDSTLCLWDLTDGVWLKSLEGHTSEVSGLAVSRDGQFIASGGTNGELIVWHGDTGTHSRTLAADSMCLTSLDFSPDDKILATCSHDEMTKLWGTENWQLQGSPITCCVAPYTQSIVYWIRYSPSGEHLAIATENDIQIWNPSTRKCITAFKAHAAIENAYNGPLQWTPDGRRLLSAGSDLDPNILEWDTLTWQQVGDPWKGHRASINAIATNTTGTLIASSSDDEDVRLWKILDRQTIAIFKHSREVLCVTFTLDSKYVLSGGYDAMISQWRVPLDALQEGESELQQARDAELNILALHTAVRGACLEGKLEDAVKLLTKEIDADPNKHIPYANRSFLMSRLCAWKHALRDANQSIAIKPSLTGYISKGIVLCRNKQFQEATTAFDIAFTFAKKDSSVNHLLFLIKVIALFNANKHDEAIQCIGELSSTLYNDPIPFRIVEAYLHVKLGSIALDDTIFGPVPPLCPHKVASAIDHFTTAVNASSFFFGLPIHTKYEVFIELFGWDLKSLWETANKQLCHALLLAGEHRKAFKLFYSMMDKCDEPTKASLVH
ncbi:WD40 repeat-like protein [Suillus hirtellus]|nr:WD40 repeat-like protein [Suillus hirtellus]